MKRERLATAAVAAAVVALAGIPVSCGDAPVAPAPGLTVTSDGTVASESGTKLTLFRLRGDDVGTLTLRLVEVRAGETDTIRERVYDSLPSSPDASLTVLESPGEPYGQPDRWDIELVGLLPGGNHGFDRGPATGRDVREAGNQCVRERNIEPGTTTILWATTLWPADGEVPGGRRFDTVEDARLYTAENAATVVLATLSRE